MNIAKVPFVADRTESLPQLPPGVRLTTLSNGLQLILREDHSAPVTSVQAWSRAGSIDEGAWLGAGLSHVLEHMLFKGTSTRGSGRIDQEVQAAGGYMNAYTSFDRTVYWINVPNTGTRVAVDILCDILQNATLPADELVKELDVIRREMDMGIDDPGRRSSQQLFETAYTRSPYRHPIIGHLDIFNRLTREDIAAYYREKCWNRFEPRLPGPEPGRSRNPSCRWNRGRWHRAKRSPKRRWNWPIFTLPGTRPTCVTPTPPPSTFCRPFSVEDEVRGFTRQSARRPGWLTRSTPGPTPPGWPAFSG